MFLAIIPFLETFGFYWEGKELIWEEETILGIFKRHNFGGFSANLLRFYLRVAASRQR